MQTTRYPLWKSVLWILGIVAILCALGFLYRRVGVGMWSFFAPHEMCDGAGCADHFVAETAEAPHPPAWLPWGH